MLHPFRIAEVLNKKEWQPFFKEAWQKLLRNHIVKVGQSHGEDWNTNTITFKFQCHENDKIDLLFCAMLLRLSDILDFDDTRAPKILYN